MAKQPRDFALYLSKNAPAASFTATELPARVVLDRVRCGLCSAFGLSMCLAAICTNRAYRSIRASLSLLARMRSRVTVFMAESARKIHLANSGEVTLPIS